MLSLSLSSLSPPALISTRDEIFSSLFPSECFLFDSFWSIFWNKSRDSFERVWTDCVLVSVISDFCYGMIDCITACFEGLFLSNEDSPPSPRPRRRGTPSSRSSNRSATYNPFTVFKEDSDIDSSSNHLLHEDRAAIELQRQEQIEKYTHRDLLYKQPVNTGADTSNIDNDEPECVMW